MTKKLLYTLSITLTSLVGIAQNPVDTLKSILQQKDYFLLEEQFQSLKPTLNPSQQLYFLAYLDNAFNRNRECVEDVNSFLSTNPAISDSSKAALLLVQSDSYMKFYQYASAANVDSLVIHHYANALDSAKLADVNNDWIFRKALASTSPQTMELKKHETINWHKDKMSLMEVPVSTSSGNYDAVFDTRADFSCVTESYLKKLGIRKLDVSIDEGSGLTGINFKASLGVADSFYVGNILFRNVVFLVMPDETLHFSEGIFNFQINVIVGAPIIEQLGELHIAKKGTISIPLQHTQENLHNLATEFYSPVIRLNNNGTDWLHFYIDLGASTTQLFPEYYAKYQTQIDQDRKEKSIRLGGAGGSTKKNVYVIPQVQLSAGGKTATMKKVQVLTEKVSNSNQHFGNIGQDFVRQFDEIIFNFKEMYFKAD